MNGNTEGHIVPLLESVSLKKRKKVRKSICQPHDEVGGRKEVDSLFFVKYEFYF